MKFIKIDMDYDEEIATIGLTIKAIKLNPHKPFTWASGYRMPIYNDNRMFLSQPLARGIIAEAFRHIIDSKNIPYDFIAGTSTAGISPATSLADLLSCPLIYIRDKPKDHGLRNQIEGIDAESNLQSKKVILIEDLISTGGSSVKAVNAIREAKGKINYCLSIFDYGFDIARKMFEGKEQFDDKGTTLSSRCNLIPILDYNKLLEIAKKTKYINDEQARMLEEWRLDPFGWGTKHGFPPEKSK